MPVERGVRRGRQPTTCAGRCRLACEVSGIELGEGGVDVVDVEHDYRRDPIVRVDLGDGENLGVERVGPVRHRPRRHE